MIDEDKIYFINTPVEIQEAIYYETLEYLQSLNIDNRLNVYLVFTQVPNLNNKFYFKVYIRQYSENAKMIDDEPDFIIFHS